MSTIVIDSTIADTQLGQVARFTANLAQAAATYDLCTASAAVQIDKVTVYVSTAGATFTSVSIQTNQTNAAIIMSAAEGAVANLIAQKNLVLTNASTPITLEANQKLQFTLLGLTGTGSLLITISYRPVVAGARLT